MDFSLIGAPVLRLECFDPSILKTERPPRHLRSINVVTVLSAYDQHPGRFLPRVAGSFCDPERKSPCSSA